MNNKSNNKKNIEKEIVEVDIKYFSDDYEELVKTERGDRVDLRVDSIIKIQKINEHGEVVDLPKEEVEKANKEFKEGKEFKYTRDTIIMFGLGVAMKLPKGHEAIVSPRSSTFKHWGLVQTNSIGVIDEKYQGNTDQWCAQMLAMRNGTIERHSRIGQFRMQEKMKHVVFNKVDFLKGEDRGGYGTSGKQ